MAFWNPLTCLTACLIVYTIGEFLSKKTKGAIASLLFACILFLGGFWTGILPKDVTTQSGLTTIMSNFGTALMITNIGSLIDIAFLVEDLEKSLVITDGIQAEGHDGPRQLSHIPPDSGQGQGAAGEKAVVVGAELGVKSADGGKAFISIIVHRSGDPDLFQLLHYIIFQKARAKHRDLHKGKTFLFSISYQY